MFLRFDQHLLQGWLSHCEGAVSRTILYFLGSFAGCDHVFDLLAQGHLGHHLVVVGAALLPWVGLALGHFSVWLLIAHGQILEPITDLHFAVFTEFLPSVFLYNWEVGDFVLFSRKVESGKIDWHIRFLIETALPHWWLLHDFLASLRSGISQLILHIELIIN